MSRRAWPGALGRRLSACSPVLTSRAKLWHRRAQRACVPQRADFAFLCRAQGGRARECASVA
eukprot:979970-Prymnesium_polylepis.1